MLLKSLFANACRGFTCTSFLSLALLVLFPLVSNADGPADNVATKVRPIPPVGIPIPDKVQQELIDQAKKIEDTVLGIQGLDLREAAEVLVFSRAVRMTVRDKMFYNEKDFDQARAVLATGLERAQWLASGKKGAKLIGLSELPSDKPQLLVGGFRSELDQSVQPYGLVVPGDLDLNKAQTLRLDVWLHGRGENVSEVAFLNQRMKQAGEIAPPNTIVLHPYGRYCNAFKFAGEIDVLEAIEHVKKRFPIDSNRIVIRGFSMGGAGCWQMAVHYPDLWMAATPGAGFSETTEFLRVFQQEEFKPTPFQKSLLHWYDCPDWANNLRYLPTVAYSGEIDKQKQAADMMVAACEARGMKLPHIIGPQTAHKLHPDSKIEIEKFISQAAVKGRVEVPTKIDLTTYSLRYHKHTWLSIEGLQEHWKEARVEGELLAGNKIAIKTKNISRLTITLPSDQDWIQTKEPVLLAIDGQSLQLPESETGRPLSATLALVENKWNAAPKEPAGTLRKRPGLQGPIDDAFMSSFVFVGPSRALIEKQPESASRKWIESEFAHAQTEWRRQFRGDIVDRQAEELSDEDIQKKNLILFGTPETNPVIRRIVEKLPVGWKGKHVTVGSREYSADTHVPMLIYPNPLNPDRYVVINSGFTYREFAYLNNARQIPMLPDWAIVDVTAGANFQMPGEVKEADFFDEKWQIK